MAPLKRLCDLNTRVLREDTDPHFDFLYADLAAVNLETRKVTPRLETFSEAPSRARRLVFIGDSLIPSLTGSTNWVQTRPLFIKGVELASIVFSTGFFTVTPRPGLDSRFLNYTLASLPILQQLEAQSSGVTMKGFSAEALGNQKIPVPDIKTQCAIADYLDTETARIDALIEKKQRMLELLWEQFESRLTAIFDVRGVPTPALSVVVRIAEGQVDPMVEPFASMMLIAPDHVESGTGRLLQATSAAEQGAISGKYLCEAGDVIYSKIRPALRKVCIATDQCLTSADMYPMRPSPELVPRYLSYFLLSDRFSSYAVLESERVAMPKINRDAFGRIRIPIPTRLEQLRVVDELDAAQSHLRSVSDRVSRQSESLREFRQALITAAVTGELEVPGVAA